MTASTTSLAEYYRRHREAFELALELRCTPKEAERILRRRTTVRRAACGRLAPPAQAAPSTDIEPIEPEPSEYRDWSAPWMMRD